MNRPVHLWILGCALVCALPLPASGQDCLTLLAPELLDIVESDRQVEVWWRDAHPESLTCVHEPRLGTSQSPWKGNASLSSGGFYTGACDFEYKFTVTATDSVTVRWTEVDWLTGAQPRRLITLALTDVPYELSDGVTLTVLSTGLFTITDSQDWTPADPAFHGIYTGGADSTADVPVVFTLSCVVGADVTESSGGAVIAWSDDAGGSGSIEVAAAGVDYEVDKGLLANFPAGTYVAGDTIVMEALRPFVSNDLFSIKVETFDGYQVLRRSVEDKPGVYKVVANISRCDTAAFFLPVDGTRYFMDRGIRGEEEGVTPDPDAPTVLNGFPYHYAVVTYDVLDDPESPGKLVRSPIDPVEVFPTPPVGGSVEDVYVVPNPYLFSAGWEQHGGGSGGKLQFFNVPQGAEITIFDAAGNYVRTIRPEMMSDGQNQSGRAEWDLRNEGGTDIISGVYLYHIKAGGNEKVGRFVVVR